MVAIYARTSREQGNEKESTIEQQIEAGIKWATFHDEEYKIYQDKGISGYKLGKDDFTKISEPFGYGSPLNFGDTIYFKAYAQKIFDFDTDCLKNYKYDSAVITYKDEKGNIKTMFFKDE